MYNKCCFHNRCLPKDDSKGIKHTNAELPSGIGDSEHPDPFGLHAYGGIPGEIGNLFRVMYVAEENLSERFHSNVKMQALGACIRSKTYLQPGNLCVFPFLESFSP